MKKLLLLLLLAFSLLVSTGCDNNTKHKLTYERLEEEKDMLYSYPKEGLYKVGEELVIKVYVVTDTSLHVFLNKEDLRQTDSERIKENDDSFFVNVFKFKMPDNDLVIHLTFDQFYGKEEYSFSDILYQVRNYEHNNNEIDKVEMSVKDESEYFNKHIYTNDTNSINMVLDMFKQKLTRYSGLVDNNNAISYFLFDKNGYNVIQVNMVDKCVVYQDFNSRELFKLPDNVSLPTFDGDVTYTFRIPHEYNRTNVKVYKDEEIISEELSFSSLGMFEFKRISSSELDGMNVLFKIETSYGDIELVSPSRFYFNGEAYEIVGDNDFSYWRVFSPIE